MVDDVRIVGEHRRTIAEVVRSLAERACTIAEVLCSTAENVRTTVDEVRNAAEDVRTLAEHVRGVNEGLCRLSEHVRSLFKDVRGQYANSHRLGADRRLQPQKSLLGAEQRARLDDHAILKFAIVHEL